MSPARSDWAGGDVELETWMKHQVKWSLTKWACSCGEQFVTRGEAEFHVMPDIDCQTLSNGDCIASPCRLHDPVKQ